MKSILPILEQSLGYYQQFKKNFSPILADSLQYIWVFSHSVTLISTLFYLGCIVDAKKKGNNPNSFWYKAADLGAVFTYSVVLYRRYSLILQMSFSNNKEGMEEKQGNEEVANNSTTLTKIPLSEILKSENAHLLMFSLLWLSTPVNLLKILPFSLYSLLNLSHYLSIEILPDSQFSDAIIPLINYLETPMLVAASHLDILNFLVLGKECFKFKNGYSLALYTLTWCLRLETSEATRYSFHNIIAAIDYLVENSTFLPKSIKNCWLTNLRKSITTLIPLNIVSDEKNINVRSNQELDYDQETPIFFNFNQFAKNNATEFTSKGFNADTDDNVSVQDSGAINIVDS
ncbi:hypothetical protein PACTADRAFT_80329 [Pachysolen tannophilus NRRL Y-2460]|uniref:Uncharacterized protein n=1 Tax=Pachysolen tannophilus NRRL Y-2460 TaxID=669874 RepID=A0A1E4TXA2_PACTA|nr:hypothetical protein PACTADRAFT_80329 [Pachysolen tannophilus NRRL Y-2460]